MRALFSSSRHTEEQHNASRTFTSQTLGLLHGLDHTDSRKRKLQFFHHLLSSCRSKPISLTFFGRTSTIYCNINPTVYFLRPLNDQSDQNFAEKPVAHNLLHGFCCELFPRRSRDQETLGYLSSRSSSLLRTRCCVAAVIQVWLLLSTVEFIPFKGEGYIEVETI